MLVRQLNDDEINIDDEDYYCFILGEELFSDGIIFDFKLELVYEL